MAGEAKRRALVVKGGLHVKMAESDQRGASIDPRETKSGEMFGTEVDSDTRMACKRSPGPLPQSSFLSARAASLCPLHRLSSHVLVLISLRRPCDTTRRKAKS